MSNRASMLAKVRALLAKTVDNGCTEGEALAALALARRLMDEHEITETDLAAGAERVTEHRANVEDRDEIRRALAGAVGRFCAVRVWRGDRGVDELVFCGLQSDVLFASWLLDMLADFVRRELMNYLAANPRRQRVRRLETNGFVMACTGRICERLNALAEPTPRGRGLVVAKGALIDEYMAARGIALRDRGGRSKWIDRSADDAGARAGDGAQFNRPVNGGRPVQSIGRG